MRGSESIENEAEEVDWKYTIVKKQWIINQTVSPKLIKYSSQLILLISVSLIIKTDLTLDEFTGGAVQQSKLINK